MKEQLNKVLHEAKEKLAEAETQADMEEIRVKMLGKKGKITSMLKSMGKLAPEDRKEFGKAANKARKELEFQCIKIIGGSKRKYASIGDIIVV